MYSPRRSPPPFCRNNIGGNSSQQHYEGTGPTALDFQQRILRRGQPSRDIANLIFDPTRAAVVVPLYPGWYQPGSTPDEVASRRDQHCLTGVTHNFDGGLAKMKVAQITRPGAGFRIVEHQVPAQAFSMCFAAASTSSCRAKVD